MSIFSRNKENDLLLSVPGMHCDNCERKVKQILESIPGVESAKPSANAGTVTIRLDGSSPADESTIRGELKVGGYPAE